MAQGYETTLNPLVIGTDFSYPFHVKNEALDTSINITGYALSWMLKRSIHDADLSASVTKTTAGGGVVISGTFNATPASNTQRATVTIADTDTDALAPGVYYWELKRTDAGLETPIAYGKVPLVRRPHRS